MYDVALKLYKIGVCAGDLIIARLPFSDDEKREINNYLTIFENDDFL